MFVAAVPSRYILSTPPTLPRPLMPHSQEADIPWPPSVSDMLTRLALLEMARGREPGGPAGASSEPAIHDGGGGGGMKMGAAGSEQQAAYTAYKCALLLRRSQSRRSGRHGPTTLLANSIAESRVTLTLAHV